MRHFRRLSATPGGTSETGTQIGALANEGLSFTGPSRTTDRPASDTSHGREYEIRGDLGGVLPSGILDKCAIGGNILSPGTVTDRPKFQRLRAVLNAVTVPKKKNEITVSDTNSLLEQLAKGAPKTPRKTQKPSGPSRSQQAEALLEGLGEFKLPSDSQVYGTPSTSGQCNSDIVLANIAGVPTPICTNCLEYIHGNSTESSRLLSDLSPSTHTEQESSQLNTEVTRTINEFDRLRGVPRRQNLDVSMPTVPYDKLPAELRETFEHTVDPKKDKTTFWAGGLDQQRAEIGRRGLQDYKALLQTHNLDSYLGPQNKIISSPAFLSPEQLNSHVSKLRYAIESKQKDLYLLSELLSVGKKGHRALGWSELDLSDPDKANLEFQDRIGKSLDYINLSTDDSRKPVRDVPSFRPSVQQIIPGEPSPGLDFQKALLQRETNKARLDQALSRLGGASNNFSIHNLPTMQEWQSIVEHHEGLMGSFGPSLQNHVAEYTSLGNTVEEKYREAYEGHFGTDADRQAEIDEELSQSRRRLDDIRQVRKQLRLPPLGTKTRKK